jgi:hypothetical protein
MLGFFNQYMKVHCHTQPYIQLLLIVDNDLSMLAMCFNLIGQHQAIIQCLRENDHILKNFCWLKLIKL